MKAMMLTGIGQMELMDVPDPEIREADDVLIRMKTIGVCGSDIHYYRTGKIGDQVVSYPFPVGHEGAGEVVATGPAVTRVSPGDRVAIEPAMPCWECNQCLAGRPHTCEKLRFLGCPGQADGCMSELIVMPETSCFRLSDELSLDHGALSEPLAIGLYAVKRSAMTAGMDIAILGYGPIGMSVMLSAQHLGAGRISVSEKIDERVRMAGEAGAMDVANPLHEKVGARLKQEVPEGYDIVFECCGQQEAVDDAIELLKPGGKLMIVGIPEIENWSIPVSRSRHKEVTIINVRRQNDCVEEALGMIAEGKVDVDRMKTHRYSFAQSKKAFDLVADYADGVMKAMIDFD